MYCFTAEVNGTVPPQQRGRGSHTQRGNRGRGRGRRGAVSWSSAAVLNRQISLINDFCETYFREHILQIVVCMPAFFIGHYCILYLRHRVHDLGAWPLFLYFECIAVLRQTYTIERSRSGTVTVTVTQYWMLAHCRLRTMKHRWPGHARLSQSCDRAMLPGSHGLTFQLIDSLALVQRSHHTDLLCLRWRRRHYVVANTEVCARFSSLETSVIALNL